MHFTSAKDELESRSFWGIWWNLHDEAKNPLMSYTLSFLVHFHITLQKTAPLFQKAGTYSKQWKLEVFLRLLDIIKIFCYYWIEIIKITYSSQKSSGGKWRWSKHFLRIEDEYSPSSSSSSSLPVVVVSVLGRFSRTFVKFISYKQAKFMPCSYIFPSNIHLCASVLEVDSSALLHFSDQVNHRESLALYRNESKGYNVCRVEHYICPMKFRLLFLTKVLQIKFDRKCDFYGLQLIICNADQITLDIICIHNSLIHSYYLHDMSRHVLMLQFRITHHFSTYIHRYITYLLLHRVFNQSNLHTKLGYFFKNVVRTY